MSGDIGFGADLLTQVVITLANRGLGAQLPSTAVKPSLIVAAVLIAFFLARRPVTSRALKVLSPRELHCLVAGSPIIWFCFFLGANVGYRAIFLLFVLPGFFAAARGHPEKWAAFACAVATDAVLILIWALPTDLFPYTWPRWLPMHI